MTRRLAFWIFLGIGVGLWAHAWAADTYKLANGNAMTGEPIAPDDRGIIFKLAGNVLSERISWTNFTDTSLQELAKDPKIKPFVEPWLFDEQQEEEAEKAVRDIKPKRGEQLDRPDPQASLSVLFASPLSMACLVLIYLANLYAAFEIAIFRNYHPAVVCTVAGILPVLGPIIFLSMPTNLRSASGVIEDVDEEQALVEAREAEALAVETAEAQAPIPQAAPAPGVPTTTVYQRGQFTFNRRFFETKLAGFARTVPDGKTKNLVLCIESARGMFIGERIARLDPNELCLLVTKGGASAEVSIPFTEIKEVQVRPKDA